MSLRDFWHIPYTGTARSATVQRSGVSSHVQKEADGAPPSPTAVIEAEHLRVHYAASQTPALTVSHLHVAQGERLALTGANGAGKSTLLKTLAGLIRPDAGTVRLFGKEPGQTRDRIAYLPQLRAIDWHYPISVGEFVLLGASVRLGWFRRADKIWKARSLELLQRLELFELRHRPIRALSGGEQQRLLFARALLPDPDLFLLDEPLTAVDAHSVEVIGSLLHDAHCAGKTLVIATHHLDFGGVFRFDRRLRMHCGCVHAVETDAEALHEEAAARDGTTAPLHFRIGSKAAKEQNATAPEAAPDIKGDDVPHSQNGEGGRQ